MPVFRGLGGAGSSDDDATISAVTAQAQIATTKANEASASANSAASSSATAVTKADEASTSATNAANSASKADEASTSATNAANSASAAEAAQEAIDDFFLGVKTTNPTLDNNGNAVTAGDWYFNSVDNSTRIYDGSNWNTINPDLVGDLTPQLGGTLDANGNDIDMGTNVITDTKVGQWDTAYSWGDHSTEGYLTSVAFGDLTSTPTTLSGYGITDAATSAQGALADSAVQPNDNISTLTNDAGYTTNTGTVTSVALTAPTGLSVAGSPVTTTGTLALTFTSGYSIPTTASQGNWDTAYGWGNHASAGYLTSFTETNNLSVAVTWANVPDVNITQSSVTQHQAALSIAGSQITGTIDGGTY
jgi:hypothetical protein